MGFYSGGYLFFLVDPQTKTQKLNNTTKVHRVVVECHASTPGMRQSGSSSSMGKETTKVVQTSCSLVKLHWSLSSSQRVLDSVLHKAGWRSSISKAHILWATHGKTHYITTFDVLFRHFERLFFLPPQVGQLLVYPLPFLVLAVQLVM